MSQKAIREYAKRSHTDLGVVENIEQTLREYASADQYAMLINLLAFLDSRIGSLVLCSSFTLFSDLPLDSRRQAFHSWSLSRFAAIRNIHKTFKTLTLRAFFCCTKETPNGVRTNVNWDVIGYPGPDPQQHSDRFTSPSARERMFDFSPHILSVQRLQEMKEDKTNHFDAIVAGSGPGAAVVCERLVRDGKRVLVIEKGEYVSAEDLSLVEDEAVERLFENAGIVGTSDGTVQVLGRISLTHFSLSLLF